VWCFEFLGLEGPTPRPGTRNAVTLSSEVSMHTSFHAVGTQETPQTQADEQLVERVKGGDLSAFEQLMRRHNQKLYRAVRSVLRDEVEDVMQDTYLAAFRQLHQFAGRAKFSTWLLRIGFNEALARMRRHARMVDLDELPENQTTVGGKYGTVRTPEQQASNHEVLAIVEAALDRIPDDYRQVFMLRMIDSLDTAEVADVLGLSEAAVQQRLHRARAMLQGQIEAHVGKAVRSAFGFLGSRCDRVVANVIRRTRWSGPSDGSESVPT
jgi:RNA polymerase sigma-70 factor, ECF subfamily